MWFERFADLNPPAKKVNMYSIAEVKSVLRAAFDWHFLPEAALDIVNRYSLSTVEVIDMLYQYRYVEPEELCRIMTYSTGLTFAHAEQASIAKLKTRIATKNDVLAFQSLDGMNSIVYMSAAKPYSNAQLEVELPGHKTEVYYLLPLNYELAKSPDHVIRWNYYTMFGRYMFYCIEHKATDIHFEVLHENKKTRYRAMCRIGPDREECTLFDMTEEINQELIRAAVKERSSNQQSQLDLDAGRGIVVNLADIFSDGRLEVRFTANKVLGGYYCVCRLQETKTVSMTLDQLGFDPKIVKAVREITERPSGLTIITGKIRTGKNTTMAAVATDIIAKETNLSLMSFDDPIEIMGRYPQMDYRGEAELLKAGIRLAKKMDLDFVTVNEIPNAEVAFGVRDLVNSSIHTMTTWHMNRIYHLPHKLFEYFGESYRDMVSQINLVCNQRLYKRQCPHCQLEVHRVDHEHDSRIHDFFVKYDLHSSMVSQGCGKCGGTGFSKGEIVVLPEILLFTQDLVLNLFKADRPYDMERVLFEAMKDSPFSLERQLCMALRDGRLSPRDVLSIV
ncbi:hypothetical protein AGMMS49975_10110 [Clostridia bacterium]|nr:hypothetical protein AGMMS49975_10110 [Clostridia bacterium]